MKRIFITLALLVLSVGGVWFMGQAFTAPEPAENTPPLEAISALDLQQYQGTWYELASIPMFFQRNCAQNTQAHYTVLENGQVEVKNQCETQEGKIIQAKGQAKRSDPEEPAQLKVTFVNLFGWHLFLIGGDYWVLDWEPAQRDASGKVVTGGYALIGQPNRKYGWILSRRQSIPLAELQALTHKLETFGYDPCRFNATPQTGGIQTIQPLCKFEQE